MAQVAEQQTAADRLARLVERVRDWRSTRVRRSPMPAVLWEEAVRLGQPLGVHPVKAALGLNYESLRQRVADAAESGSSAPRLAEECCHTTLPLEVRHIDVQVHPVDALHFERDMRIEDFNHRAGLWYEHWRAPVVHGPSGPTPLRRLRWERHCRIPFGSTGAHFAGSSTCNDFRN
jgi:hypothetical protein